MPYQYFNMSGGTYNSISGNQFNYTGAGPYYVYTGTVHHSTSAFYANERQGATSAANASPNANNDTGQEFATGAGEGRAFAYLVALMTRC